MRIVSRGRRRIGRSGAPSIYWQLTLDQVMENWSPETEPGDALIVPPDEAMKMVSVVTELEGAIQSPSDFVCPPMLAWQPVKVRVPKFANGSTPPDHGASATHSA